MKTKIKTILTKISLFLIIIILSETEFLYSQEIRNKSSQVEFKNVIKSNPFYAIGGWVPITYERFISSNKSLMINASYITNPSSIALGILGDSYPYESRKGFYLNPAMRFYLLKNDNASGGFYGSPEIGFIQQTKTLALDSIYKGDTFVNGTPVSVYKIYPQSILTFREFQVAATVGYQKVFHKVFVVDIYVGEGLSILSFSGDVDPFKERITKLHDKRWPKDGSRLLAGFKIGVAF